MVSAYKGILSVMVLSIVTMEVMKKNVVSNKNNYHFFRTVVGNYESFRKNGN